MKGRNLSINDFQYNTFSFIQYDLIFLISDYVGVAVPYFSKPNVCTEKNSICVL